MREHMRQQAMRVLGSGFGSLSCRSVVISAVVVSVLMLAGGVRIVSVIGAESASVRTFACR
jgi:hypothetical protein